MKESNSTKAGSAQSAASTFLILIIIAFKSASINVIFTNISSQGEPSHPAGVQPAGRQPLSLAGPELHVGALGG
jgi:hypothetical protein